MLPVLLDSLRGDWQANELERPLARLKAMDNNGLLRRTLAAWFRHNVQPLATSKALFIHRNTLDVRRKRRWWWVNIGCQRVAANFLWI